MSKVRWVTRPRANGLLQFQKNEAAALKDQTLDFCTHAEFKVQASFYGGLRFDFHASEIILTGRLERAVSDPNSIYREEVLYFH